MANSDKNINIRVNLNTDSIDGKAKQLFGSISDSAKNASDEVKNSTSEIGNEARKTADTIKDSARSSADALDDICESSESATDAIVDFGDSASVAIDSATDSVDDLGKALKAVESINIQTVFSSLEKISQLLPKVMQVTGVSENASNVVMGTLKGGLQGAQAGYMATKNPYVAAVAGIAGMGIGGSASYQEGRDKAVGGYNASVDAVDALVTAFDNAQIDKSYAEKLNQMLSIGDKAGLKNELNANSNELSRITDERNAQKAELDRLKSRIDDKSVVGTDEYEAASKKVIALGESLTKSQDAIEHYASLVEKINSMLDGIQRTENANTETDSRRSKRTDETSRTSRIQNRTDRTNQQTSTPKNESNNAKNSISTYAQLVNGIMNASSAQKDKAIAEYRGYIGSGLPKSDSQNVNNSQSIGIASINVDKMMPNNLRNASDNVSNLNKMVTDVNAIAENTLNIYNLLVKDKVNIGWS